MAEWLGDVRSALEKGAGIDLTNRPGCVRWERLTDDPRLRQGKIVRTCMGVMGKISDGRLVVLGDSANMNARTALAQKLAAMGFTNIEPLGCKDLYGLVKKMEEAEGLNRLEKAMDFICACMTHSEKAAFLNSVKSRQGGGKLG